MMEQIDIAVCIIDIILSILDIALIIYFFDRIPLKKKPKFDKFGAYRRTKPYRFGKIRQ